MITKFKTIKRLISASAAAVCMISAFNLPPIGDEETAAADTMTAFEITENMQIGWNIGNSLDAPSETAWGNPTITKELIDAVKAKGFNTVRVPTTWYTHMDGDNKIDESWLNRVQEVVDYAYSQDMYVILNLHHEEWVNRADIGTAYYEMSPKLIKIWQQIAERFKDYDQHLIFEGMNEPRAVGTSHEWWGPEQSEIDTINKLNADFVNTVRSVESPYKDTRLLMIPPYCASSEITIMNKLEIPDDDYVAASIHAYSPYNFTMNTGTGAQHDTYTESFDAELGTILSNIQKTFLEKDIPVIIGEFGASNFNNTDARCEWAKSYITKAKNYGIPCVLWDNNTITNSADPGECHGYINRSSYEWYDVSEPVVDTMMEVINDPSIKWGNSSKSPTYSHQDMSEGDVLYNDAAGELLDASSSKFCSANYAVTPAQLEGKDIAVKFTGDAPVAAFMDSSWGGWTEVAPYEVDKEAGIAYISGEAVKKSWSSDTEFSWLCFKTSGVTTITMVSIIDAAEIEETTDPIFTVQNYDLTLPADTRDGNLVLYLEGDAGAETNGCVGFMNGEDWSSITWETVLGDDGKTEVSIPMSEIPEGITSAQAQIWWAAVGGEFADIKLTDYSIITETTEIIYGDADLDGETTMDDVVLILCNASDKTQYPLSAEAVNAADVYQRGDGISANDAVSVQKLLTLQIDSLPESYAN